MKSLDEQLEDPFGDTLDFEAVFEVIEDITEFPNLIASIKKRGYSDSEVGKIQGDNFLRTFKEVLKWDSSLENK